jgi:hypothetical protein
MVPYQANVRHQIRLLVSVIRDGYQEIPPLAPKDIKERHPLEGASLRPPVF